MTVIHFVFLLIEGLGLLSVSQSNGELVCAIFLRDLDPFLAYKEPPLGIY